MDNMKVAIVTQSYRKDLEECILLCESIDRFVPNDICHYIFVNDEDYNLFRCARISDRHVIRRKSDIIPAYLFRFPFKLLGHHYHVSPFTIPVREWIIQQICKLGAFDAIDKECNVIINIDSETVFMRPFSLSDIMRNGKFVLFRENFRIEPCHKEYCKVAKAILHMNADLCEIEKYCYMTHPVVFIRENIEELQNELELFSIVKNWKYKLCNTYRFSEYYLYGIFTDFVFGMRNHELISKHLFPMIDITKCTNSMDLICEIVKQMNDPEILGVWLQKQNRNDPTLKFLSFNQIQKVIRELWSS